MNTGAAKLKEDCLVNHLFCTYSETYKDVVIRIIEGKFLADLFFKTWEPDYFKNYDPSAPANSRRQRYRKNIPSRYVDSNGHIILKIKDGVIIERYDDLLNNFNSENLT